jgi:hypothetical protein
MRTAEHGAHPVRAEDLRKRVRQRARLRVAGQKHYIEIAAQAAERVADAVVNRILSLVAELPAPD